MKTVMKNRKKFLKKKTILALLLGLTLLFIWGHSLADRAASANESGLVLELLSPILELVMGKGNVTDHFVRKLAHFSEFFALGAELLWFFSLDSAGKEVLSERACLLALSHGMLSALLDETVQIFSGRSAAVPDIWLDSAGTAAGILIALVLIRIFVRKKT